MTENAPWFLEWGSVMNAGAVVNYRKRERDRAFWQLPFPAHPFRMGDSRLNILIGWMRAHQWKREDSIRRLRQGIISVSYVSLDLTVLEKQWQWPSCRILISVRYATVEIRMQASFMADGLSDYPSCTSVRPW